MTSINKIIRGVLQLLICASWYKAVASKMQIQSLEDNIAAENFTYYRLHRPGTLRLELLSIVGDVDMYISTESQHPTYAHYDLKSETCGLDVISIPSSMSRPVYIGLFGHPNHLQSRCRLTIFEEEEPVVDDYQSYVDMFEKYYFDGLDESSSEQSSGRESSSKTSSKPTSKDNRQVDDELPIWWKILLGILEFGIEVIL
ncbi:UPF0669 protein C6orf120 homolog [Aplysia californica]|uniref:UPF0669 protein C6orf120 homolog n=1 Tax=Aplysia californica TaxID=6500 RepID=A0ABM0K9W5_APLCA|nr:UPF0669 protein C6orf120 homolog [Aplysia californica]